MDELLNFKELEVLAAEQRCPEFLLEALNDTNVLAGWTHVTQVQVRAGPGQKHLLALGRGGGKPRCRFAHTSQRLLEGHQCSISPSARKLRDAEQTLKAHRKCRRPPAEATVRPCKELPCHIRMAPKKFRARKLAERQRTGLRERLRGRRAVAPRSLLELGEERLVGSGSVVELALVTDSVGEQELHMPRGRAPKGMHRPRGLNEQLTREPRVAVLEVEGGQLGVSLVIELVGVFGRALHRTVSLQTTPEPDLSLAGGLLEVVSCSFVLLPVGNPGGVHVVVKEVIVASDCMAILVHLHPAAKAVYRVLGLDIRLAAALDPRISRSHNLA